MIDFAGIVALPWYVTLTVICLSIAPAVAVWRYSEPSHRARRRSRANYQLLIKADQRTADLSRGRTERLIAPVLLGITSRARRVAPSSLMKTLERVVERSGRAQTWTGERLLGLQVLGLFLGAAFGGLAFGVALPDRILAGVIFFGAAGAAVPLIKFRRYGRQWQKLIGQDLADVIDQITISVEAGLGFDAAVMRVARDSQSPLCQELGRAVQDMRIGLSRDEALSALVDRTDVEDLKHFVSSVSQANELGVPLGKALRFHASDLRRQRRVRAEEQAMKIGVKLTFPTVLVILPALLLVVLGPAAISIMDSFGAAQ